MAIVLSGGLASHDVESADDADRVDPAPAIGAEEGRRIGEAWAPPWTTSGHRFSPSLTDGSLDAFVESGAQVVIDFTHPDAVMANLKGGIEGDIHAVVGTTGSRGLSESSGAGGSGSTPEISNDNSACGRCRFRTTTDSKHDFPIAPNVLERFTASAPIGHWLPDITFVWTRRTG